MKRHLLTIAVLGGLIVMLVLINHVLGIRLYDRIATNLCISLVLVLGLQVFMGNSGILSFAHMGFMGIGAYTSAVLTIPAQMKGMALPDIYPFLQSVELSPYLAIAAGGLWRRSWRRTFLSADAIVGRGCRHHLVCASGRALHRDDALEPAHQRTAHAVRFAEGDRPSAGCGGCRAGADRSPCLQGIAHRPPAAGKPRRRDAAAALGAHIPQLRWRAFILAALFAGVGGALWGHFITSFSPKAFYLKETFLILGMLVIGGANTVTGAVVGTFIVTIAYESLRGLEGVLNEAKIMTNPVVGLTEIVLALAMIAVLALRPGGLFPIREIGVLLTRAKTKENH